jgi:hydrophobic/amphiphilic exporter-1 (mainly G- bacteria), HAE1 family
MQKLAEICIKRPVFATMLILFLVVMGIDAYFKLGVDYFPKIEFPVVQITTTLRGASPEEVESQVSKRIEEAVNTVSGIEDLSSVSAEGISLVVIQFDMSKDADAAAQEVRDKIARIAGDLPRDADPPVVDKLATDASPVLNVVVSSPRDLRETTKVVEDRIKKNLETLPGVGQVRFVGDRRRQIQILLDSDRMFSYRLNVDQVRAALASQNVEVPGGRIDQNTRELSVRTMGRVERPEDFKRVIVGSANGSPIRISDIASVVDGFEEPRSLARLDGKPAVVLEVRKQSGTNTLSVIQAVKSRIDELRPLLPKDYGIAYTRDQSGFIQDSYDAVKEHLILGGFLAGGIVLLFLWSLRLTLIAAVAIPTSIIATFTLMNLMGFTLNQITMLALTLMVGIVIDDAIVVLENIFRFMEEKHLSPVEAAIEGVRDIGLAVLATTLSLAIIFLPVAFMTGIVGRFMSSFGFTAAFAIMVSLVVSFTLTPMLCSRFLKPNKSGESTKDTWLFRMLAGPYRAMLAWSMSHRWAVVLLAMVVMGSTPLIFRVIGVDFLAQDDQSEFEITVRTPPGSSLEGTNAVVKKLEEDVKQLPGIRNIAVTIGADQRQQVDRAQIVVELVLPEDRQYDQFQLMEMARKSLAKYRDLTIGVQQPAVIQGGDNKALQFFVQGPDLEQLDKYASVIRAKLRSLPGVVDVDTNYEPGKPELRVKINRDRASDLNVNVASIAGAMRTMVGGDTQATTYREGDERYDVMLRAAGDYRASPEMLNRLFVPSATLGNVPLSNVARIEGATGPTQINRYNRARQVLLSANIAQGSGQSLSAVLAELDTTIAGLNMPAEYRTGTLGTSKEFARAGAAFGAAFILSIVLMYMILAAQFESFVDPIVILLSLPLSAPFALISLMLARENFSLIFSSVGILVLFGIVKKNSILQIDHIKALRASGVGRLEAIMKGCEDRLRPILMTTAALVAGMLPMALGGGAGSASRRTVAIVVIGGQTFCLLLTLLVAPVAYSLFDDASVWVRSLAGRFTFRRAVAAATGMFSNFFSLLLLFAVMVLTSSTSFAQSMEQEPTRVGVGITRHPLALRDAIEMALKNNLDLEIERTNVANAQQFLNGAKGAYDGVFRWNPSLERRDTPTSSSLFGQGGKLADRFNIQNFGFAQRTPWSGGQFQTSFENTWQKTTNPFVSLNPSISSRLFVGYTQPLFRNRVFDRERAELKIRAKGIDIASSDFELRVIDIVGRTEQAYWNLVASRQDVAVTEDGVRWGREQFARTQRQIDAGTLAPVELAAAEAELQRRVDTYNTSVAGLNAAEVDLKSLLAGDRNDDIWKDVIIPLDAAGEPVSETIIALDEALTAALRQRPELKNLALRKDTAAIQHTAAAEQLKPMVNVTGGYSTYGLSGSLSTTPNPFSSAPATAPGFLVGGYGTTLSNLFGGSFQGFQGGLSVELNTRNRAAEAGVQQAIIAERRLDLDKRRIEQIIAAQLRNSLQSIESAKQRIIAAEASSRAAQEKLDSEVRLFQTGESTNFLVLTRQNEAADSRRRAVVAHLEFNRALSRLRLADGSTLEHYQIKPQ